MTRLKTIGEDRAFSQTMQGLGCKRQNYGTCSALRQNEQISKELVRKLPSTLSSSFPAKFSFLRFPSFAFKFPPRFDILLKDKSSSTRFDNDWKQIPDGIRIVSGGLSAFSDQKPNNYVTKSYIILLQSESPCGSFPNAKRFPAEPHADFFPTPTIPSRVPDTF